MEKVSPVILLFIILLTTLTFIQCFGENTTFGCISRERKALMKFRASLLNPSTTWPSWINKDCCTWDGVSCDKVTGRVIGLDLRNDITSGEYNEKNVIRGLELDSSLLDLKNLSYLDLSGSSFDYSPIPEFVGSMKGLKYLNLSYAEFSGIFPYNFGNLSNLRFLDLSGGFGLTVNELTWASRLSSLEYLDMSGVDLSQAKDLGKTLNLLPSVRILRFSGCNLDVSQLPHVRINSALAKVVEYLDLSSNSLSGEFPRFLRNMTLLLELDLSSNKYNCSVLPVLELNNLVRVKLAYNLLNCTADRIPKFNLKSLDLRGNQLYGDISKLFKNMSSWDNKLKALDLGNNDFFGLLPEELGKLEHLKYLDLSSNANVSGSFPLSLGKLKALEILRLGRNKLSGEIPISLGQLSNLKELDISRNSFNHSTLSEAHFVNLSKLEFLDTTNSLFTLRVRSDWAPPFQLKTLWMASCEIGGRFPQWLQTQKKLTRLSLSNSNISGTLPKWLRYLNLTTVDLSYNSIEGPLPNLGSRMVRLDISHNYIQGPVLNLGSRMERLDLSHNSISGNLPYNIGHAMPLLSVLNLAENFVNGSIPDSLCQMRGLVFLDFSNNHLRGSLPNCWENFGSLSFFRVSSNQISGEIPNSIGRSYSLQILTLNNNSLTGKLPSTLRNCQSLAFLDVGENKLSGKLPKWLGEDLLQLKVVRLRDNKFNGAIPLEFCKLQALQIMDLAKNKFTGSIPRCFDNLQGMVDKELTLFPNMPALTQFIKGLELEYTKNLKYLVNFDLSNNRLSGEIPGELTRLFALKSLNLSCNRLVGKIPSNIGDLNSLESLDLSSNNLWGPIPTSLSTMNFLGHLNFSHNNLSGSIPKGEQLQTLLVDPSSYEGNPQLCGPPLQKKCHEDEKREPRREQVVVNEEDKSDKVVFFAFVISGFATGFWCVIGTLVFKGRWRRALFKFVEVKLDKYL